MHDERSLDGLPIVRKIWRAKRRIFRECPLCYGIELGVLVGKLACLRINSPHLDAAPEAAEAHPHTSLRVGHNIGVNGVKIIFLPGTKNQSFVHPLEVRTVRIQSLIGHQSDAGGVLSEY